MLIDGVRDRQRRRHRRLARFRQSHRARHRPHRDPARAAVGALRLGRDGGRHQHHHQEGRQGEAGPLGDGRRRQLRHDSRPRLDVGRPTTTGPIRSASPPCTRTAFPQYGYRVDRPLTIGDGVTPLPPLPGDQPSDKGALDGRFTYTVSPTISVDAGFDVFGNGLTFANPYALIPADVFTPYNWSTAWLPTDSFAPMSPPWTARCRTISRSSATPRSTRSGRPRPASTRSSSRSIAPPAITARAGARNIRAISRSTPMAR